MLDDSLTFFKMDETFIKDPVHRTESLIWSHYLPQAFYYHSNIKLKMDDLIRTMSKNKNKTNKENLEISVCISACNDFSNRDLDHDLDSSL